MAEPSSEYEARQQIADVVIRYATAIDSRNWQLFRTCFADDCDVDYGHLGSWASADAFTEFMRDLHVRVGPTMHRITNLVVTIESDQSAARARSYYDTVVVDPDSNRLATHAIGTYDDELICRFGEWRILRRRTTRVHVQRDAVR